MYSVALTVAGCYVPFTDIGSAVINMLADKQGIKLGDGDEKELAEKFSTMSPHPEVPAALRKRRDVVFRLFTLTDNLLEVQTRQLVQCLVNSLTLCGCGDSQRLACCLDLAQDVLGPWRARHIAWRFCCVRRERR